MTCKEALEAWEQGKAVIAREPGTLREERYDCINAVCYCMEHGRLVMYLDLQQEGKPSMAARPEDVFLQEQKLPQRTPAEERYPEQMLEYVIVSENRNRYGIEARLNGEAVANYDGYISGDCFRLYPTWPQPKRGAYAAPRMISQQMVRSGVKGAV